MQSSLLAVQKNAGETEGRKGVKGLLLLGQEKVPHGFGLRTGDPSDTADGAGTKGGRPAKHGLLGRTGGWLSEPQTSISCPEIWYPRLGRGGKEGLCVFVGILRDFGILIKTLSH